jgi:hypothetical protein
MIQARWAPVSAVVLMLALLAGCMSVTDVKTTEFTAKEKGHLSTKLGLRVYGYVPRGGEEKEMDAFVRWDGGSRYRIQPVGKRGTLAAFEVSEQNLDGVMLERVDGLKTAILVPIAIVALPVVLVGFVAMGGGGAKMSGSGSLGALLPFSSR